MIRKLFVEEDPPRGPDLVAPAFTMMRQDNGLCKDVFEQQHMVQLLGRMGLAHCRYPTAGGAGLQVTISDISLPDETRYNPLLARNVCECFGVYNSA